MQVGTLDVQVLPGKTGARLVVGGSVYGVETAVTAEELRRLSRHLAAEAAKLGETPKEET